MKFLIPPSTRVLLWAYILLFSLSASSTPARKGHEYRPSSELATSPKRIVSLAPVITEILFALGAGPFVVGVTRYCDRPPKAKDLPKVGGFVDPQLEVIIALEPDMVFAMPSMGQVQILDILREKEVRVWVGFGDTLAEIEDLVTGLGNVLHLKKAAKTILGNYRKKMAAMAHKLQSPKGPPRVLTIVGSRPLVVAGHGTFIHEVIEHLGGHSVVSPRSPGWPTWSLEQVFASQPEMILFLDPASSDPHTTQTIKTFCHPKTTKPCQVFESSSPLFQRPGLSLPGDIEKLVTLISSTTKGSSP